MDYVRIGQAAPFLIDEDGNPAYPDRELLACPLCGSIIAALLVEIHNATHANS